MNKKTSCSVKDIPIVVKLGVLWGILFLMGGILGFVPGITRDEMFLGVFMVNTPHNILHIISGIIFLIASISGARTARLFFLLFGAFYGALSLIGFFIGKGLIFNLISNTPIDSWGHGFLGLVLFVTGFLSRKPAGHRDTCCGYSRSAECVPNSIGENS